jgi:hypothetical protein
MFASSSGCPAFRCPSSVYSRRRPFLSVLSPFPRSVRSGHIREYQAALFKKWKLAPNTVNQRLAALRFFYIQALKKAWSVAETPYPKKTFRLPMILSQEGVARLIDFALTLRLVARKDPRVARRSDTGEAANRTANERYNFESSEFRAQKGNRGSIRVQRAVKFRILRRLLTDKICCNVGIAAALIHSFARIGA